jgi:hypothetical protein
MVDEKKSRGLYKYYCILTEIGAEVRLEKSMLEIVNKNKLAMFDFEVKYVANVGLVATFVLDNDKLDFTAMPKTVKAFRVDPLEGLEKTQWLDDRIKYLRARLQELESHQERQ